MTDDPAFDAATSGDALTTRPPHGGASFASGVSLESLTHVFTEIQRRGGIGRGPVDAAIRHAMAFVALLPASGGVVVDLGSGGGLPGLVIAASAPAWRVHLVERRLKRVDLLRYGVNALGLGERVEVHGEDVERFVPGHRCGVDVVTARSFAPPLTVLRVARPLLRTPGTLLISDAPDGRPRWTEADLDALQLVDHGAVGGVRRVGTGPGA